MALFDIQDGESKRVTLIFNRMKVPFGMKRDGDQVWLDYNFNKPLTEELKKCMSGIKCHFTKVGDKDKFKGWTFSYCEHNMFRISFMMGLNPYERYDLPIGTFESKQPLKAHQKEMSAFWKARRRCYIAAEPGLGKSLTAIAVIENLIETGEIPKDTEVFWCAPKSALVSVQLEYMKWKCTFKVRFMTYDGMKRFAETIVPGTRAPLVLIGDEGHLLKHAQTARTICFAHVAKVMRAEHGDNCYILLLSGSPSPKSPIDWFSQTSIVCPGYLREGSIFTFKDRLAIIKQKESSTGGGLFPELIAWRDDANRCQECGKFKDSFEHDMDNNLDYHPFVKSINEVELLYQRMKGLVLVKTKKECTDLPDKIYQRIYCKPKDSTLRAMKMIAKTQPSAVKVLTLLRELSDGFQYTEEADGKKPCELCKGSGSTVNYNYTGPDKTGAFIEKLINDAKLDTSNPENVRIANQLELERISCVSTEDVIIRSDDFPQFFKEEIGDCPNCDGIGQVDNIVRNWKDTKTSKDAALIDVIENHDEIGRLVVYAGFKASIDRVIEIVKDRKWHYIRLDGRGWTSDLPGKPQDLVRLFQDTTNDEKIIFVGNPGSAGTGLTLTASPTIVYYSNDFKADSRSQSEDRIHRIGMDENRGATIIDLIHLPTDEYVLDNLQRKKRLQDMTLGQVFEVLDNTLVRADYE